MEWGGDFLWTVRAALGSRTLATVPKASIPQAQLNKYILATQQEFPPKHVINYYNCLLFSKMKMSLKPKPYILTF